MLEKNSTLGNATNFPEFTYQDILNYLITGKQEKL